MAEDKKKEPVFKDLQAEDPDAMPTEIESMCMNCGENVRHFCTKDFRFRNICPMLDLKSILQKLKMQLNFLKLLFVDVDGFVIFQPHSGPEN